MTDQDTTDTSKDMIDAAEVAKILSINKKTFYAFLKSEFAADFPPSIMFGERLSRWRRGDVQAWLNEKVKWK